MKMAKERIKLDPLKAIGVVRVSTDQQEVGAAAQTFSIEEWCKARGIELLEVYEAHISGKISFAGRKELKAALAACRSKGAGTLIAKSWDRFARNKHFFSELENECDNLGIRPITVDGGRSEAPFIRDIRQALASEELRIVSERNKRRAAQCIRDGRLHGGMPPYGQRRKEGGRMGTRNTVVELEPDPAEQKILRKMLSMRKAGATYQAISDELTERKMPARTGEWSSSKVHRIVKNETTLAIE